MVILALIVLKNATHVPLQHLVPSVNIHSNISMDHAFQIALLLTSIRIMFAMNVNQIVCLVHHLIFVQNVLIHINYSTIVALLIAQMKCIPIIIISVKTVLAHALLVYLHNIVLIATQVFITCGNQML